MNNTITKSEARQIFLEAQGLKRPAKSALEAIRTLGYVQIDTISVVARAHHHVLWSRYSKYNPIDLERLTSQKKVFEYWAHAASYLPMEDYRFCLPTMEMYRNRGENWYPVSKSLMAAVKKRIKEEGPLASKDFDHVKKGKSGWWDFKPSKRALEKLFMRGEITISKRIGFQKYFDLPERTIPNYSSLKKPEPSEFAWHLIKRNLAHHGLSRVEEMSYLRRSPFKKAVRNELQNRLESGDINRINVQGIEDTYYTLNRRKQVNQRLPNKVHILSPFDNAVIQRQKLRDLFNFDYQIECYVPEARRKFGYFSLPILYGDRFVGRIDLKAHRDQRVLMVNALHQERGMTKKKLKDFLQKPLDDFAAFNDCHRIQWK